MLEPALQFAAHYVPIFPVRVWREADRWRKKPHIKDWSARATTNPATIKAWWHSWPLALVGLPLEPLNLVVVDADRHPGGPDGVAALSAIALPPHQAVVTMSNGEHHFFGQPAPPAPRIRFATFAGVQVLGDGRLVAAYSLAPFVTPAPVLPRDLLERLPKAVKQAGSNTTHARPSTCNPFDPQPTQSTLLRSKYLILDLERAQPGNWHCALFWTACRFGNMIGERRIKTEVAKDLLIGGAKVNGSWKKDSEHCLETIRDGLRKGEQEWIEWDAGKRAGCVGLSNEGECRD